MKGKYLHSIYISLVLALLVGCTIEYPQKDFFGVKGDVVYDNTNLRVPILVAMDAAEETFDNEEEWANAIVNVYAFYTPTDTEGAPDSVDYSERMDSQDEEKVYCLVDDTDNDNKGHGKQARLSKSSLLQWEDGDVVYYNSTYPQYRYRFFAYYLGNAEVTKLERDSDRVIYDIEINGTQNLMCACASLTEKQKERFGSLSNSYSANTGALGLFPTFKMKRQLASLHFALSDDSAKGDSIRNVVITAAPCKGRFVVAAADETQMGITFNTETKDFAQSFEKEGAMFFLPAANNYAVTIQLSGNKSFSAVLDVDGGFKAGMAYTVEVKVNDSKNIEFEVK